jgi:hypothetical protein
MSPSKYEQPAFYLQSGDPEGENVPILAYPGQLGIRFTITSPQRSAPGTASGTSGRSKRYQIVKTDSTMTVAPFPGAVAFWGDKSQYVVTTTNPTNAYGRNRIAGKFSNAVTPGNYTCVQFEGPGVVKLADNVTQANVLAGAFVIADPGGVNAKANVTATGTAPVTAPLGTVSSPLVFNTQDLTVVVDLAVPETT